MEVFDDDSKIPLNLKIKLEPKIFGRLRSLSSSLGITFDDLVEALLSSEHSVYNEAENPLPAKVIIPDQISACDLSEIRHQASAE